LGGSIEGNGEGRKGRDANLLCGCLGGLGGVLLRIMIYFSSISENILSPSRTQLHTPNIYSQTPPNLQDPFSQEKKNLAAISAYPPI